MPEETKKKMVRRKRDYITWLAVFLFFFIMVFEMAVVLWLPTKLTEIGPRKAVELEEMVTLEDLLRAQLNGFKTEDKTQEGEISLARGCLDAYARYLREHKNELSLEQIREIMADLKKIETIYYSRWKSKKFLIKEEKLNASKFMEQLQKKAGIAPKAEPEAGAKEKNETPTP